MERLLILCCVSFIMGIVTYELDKKNFGPTFWVWMFALILFGFLDYFFPIGGS